MKLLNVTNDVIQFHLFFSFFFFWLLLNTNKRNSLQKLISPPMRGLGPGRAIPSFYFVLHPASLPPIAALYGRLLLKDAHKYFGEQLRSKSTATGYGNFFQRHSSEIKLWHVREVFFGARSRDTVSPSCTRQPETDLTIVTFWYRVALYRPPCNIPTPSMSSSSFHLTRLTHDLPTMASSLSTNANWIGPKNLSRDGQCIVNPCTRGYA